MTEALTLIAEEIGRAFALISSGVGVALKLNYEVMTAFITVTSRIMQLLFLLTHKTAQFFSILGNDLVLFFGDIGSGVISFYNILSRLVNGFSNVILALVTSVVSAVTLIYESFCSIQSFGLNIMKDCYYLVINFFRLMKYLFVLLGSSVMFAVAFIPNLLQLLFIGALNFVINLYSEVCLILETSGLAFKRFVNFHFNSIIDFFADISLSSVIGIILAITLFIVLRYLIDLVLTSNVILNPIMNISSFFTSIKEKIYYYLTYFSTTNQLSQHAHDSEEDNSNLFSNRDILENRPNSSRSLDNSQEGSSSYDFARNHSSIRDNNLAGMHTSVAHIQLTRKPIQRRNRTFGNFNEGKEDEIKTNTNGKCVSLSKSPDLTLANDIYKELENEREGKLCIVCQDNQKTVILLPCRHLCLCEPCRSAVIVRRNVCPICRNPILDSLRVFL